VSPSAGIARPAPAVSRPERDLVAAVRAELAAVEPTRTCCRTAERAGLGSAARGRARSPVVGRLAVRLESGESAERGGPGFDWASAREHCRVSYLRGLFLARGSLSLAAGRTHLEFVVEAEELRALAMRLAELQLPASTRLRRRRGVLTWKSSETVLTFLRRAGGRAATLELESRVVTRTLRGHLNRVLNAENANLQRSVLTAHRQLAAIAALEAAGRLSALPARVRAVAHARRRAPEQTFSELARELGTSRAQIQRAFEQIEREALRLADSTADGPR
jgi:hypothetical protein